MNTVTVSSKFQVVIPKEIRDGVGLKVGTVMEVITYELESNLFQYSQSRI